MKYTELPYAVGMLGAFCAALYLMDTHPFAAFCIGAWVVWAALALMREKRF